MGHINRHYTMPFLNTTVFLGSFLFFFIEFIVGRMMTPVFGGSAHVWLICTSFFQLMLFTGYLYNHLVGRMIGGWHILLLIGSAASLPLPVSPALLAVDGSVGWLLVILVMRFAVLLTALATTVVIVQAWLVRFQQYPNPYPLYRASNAGAILALVSYPLVVEPLLGLGQQVVVWSVGYGLFIMMVSIAYLLIRSRVPEEDSVPVTTVRQTNESSPRWRRWAYWSGLSAVTAALLMAVTHVVTAEIGSYPLVWMLPLLVYLVSFIVTFRKESWSTNRMATFWPEILLGGMLLYLLPPAYDIFLIGHFLFLFWVCLSLHGRLYNSRPHPSHLSSFYTAIALGGTVGGLAVSLAAPVVFSRLLEYPVLLTVLAVLFCHQFGFRIIFQGLRVRWLYAARLVPILLMTGMAFLFAGDEAGGIVRHRHRNFYGMSRVVDMPDSTGVSGAVRALIHESTIHGTQFLDSGRRGHPTLYYDRRGGLGDIMANAPSPMKIAAIGLGVGTVAAYTRRGDILDFYEVDPDTETIARRWFSFLSETGARARILTGDGRISLSQRNVPVRRYDLIFLDAFSGGGIPTHLLTKEAVRLYLERLAVHGFIVFHITNRHHDFRPVIKAVAQSLHLQGAVKRSIISTAESSKPVRTEYAVLTREPADLQLFLDRQWQAFGDHDGLVRCRPWTDDYVNILVPVIVGMDIPLLRWQK